MTTRRRLLLFVLPTIAVVLGVGAWLFWPRTSISDDNYEKIELGMTCAAMEALLGRTGGQPHAQMLRANLLVKRGETITNSTMTWYGEQFMIVAYIDIGIAEHASPGDKVVSVEIYEILEYQYPSPLDRFRRWLRL